MLDANIHDIRHFGSTHDDNLLDHKDVNEILDISTSFYSIFSPIDHEYVDFHDSELEEDIRSVIEPLAKETDNQRELTFETNIFPLHEHNSRNIQLSTEINDWIEQWTDHDVKSSKISGRDIRSLSILARELKRDASLLKTSGKNTIIEYDSKIKPIIKLILPLLVVGVFLPIASLLAFPPNLPLMSLSRFQLFIYQSVLLISVSILSLWLTLRMIKITDDSLID
jgi:hypothetical protein